MLNDAQWQELNTEYCLHLEQSPDDALLTDYTAGLYFAFPPEERPRARELLRAQLYSRKMAAGRVDSWLTACAERIRPDPAGFMEKARQAYLSRQVMATAEQEQAQRNAARPRLRPAAEFAPEQAEYLIEPYLPRGMLSILGGVSGTGKTSLALDIASAVSRGRPLPFDQRDTAAHGAGRNVIYLTAENDPNKVLRPRVERLGADLHHLFFQDGANLTMQDPQLAQLCRQLRPALLVFDPIQSYLGQGVQMNRAEQVRPLLDQLSALAKELDMAVLLISHMAKPGPGVCCALDRLLGSSDFRNAARSILITGRDPENPQRRVFAHGKNSLGLPGPSQVYRIGEEGVLDYEGETTLPADRIIAQTENAGPSGTRTAPSLQAAVAALDELLGFVGWVNVSEAYRLCARQGFSERTLRSAREALDLRVLRVGRPPNRRTFWYRAALPEQEVLADIQGRHEQLALNGKEATPLAVQRIS